MRTVCVLGICKNMGLLSHFVWPVFMVHQTKTPYTYAQRYEKW